MGSAIFTDATATLAIQAAHLNARYRRALKRSPAPALPALIMMTDAVRLADPVAAAERLPRGAIVILRHYGDAARESLAWRLAALCRARHLKLLIAADPALARRVGAAGVHWPDGWLRRLGRIERPRRNWLVTTAAHDRTGLQRAQRAGADAVILSPVFVTASHPTERAFGPSRFAALVRTTPLPVYALGGIDAATARRLSGSNACGVAAVGALASGGEIPAVRPTDP